MAARSCTPLRDSASLDSGSFLYCGRLSDFTPERCRARGRSPTTPFGPGAGAGEPFGPGTGGGELLGPGAGAGVPFGPGTGAGAGGGELFGDFSPPPLTTPRASAGPVAAAALCTPQTSREELRLRACLDAELQRCRGSGPAVPPAITPLVDGLYVGGIPDEEMLDALRREGVDTIINCCARENRAGEAVLRDFAVYHIAAEDRGDFLILFHCYDRFASIVNEAREQGRRVFVHCVAGINRSVTLCMAYMIEHCGMDPVLCVQFFHSRSRADILHNVSFRHQLVDFYLNTPQT